LFNGCPEDPLDADDETGKAAITLQAWSNGAPNFEHLACVRVSPGTVVTWEGSFDAHPLVGGTKMGGIEAPDSNSPITLAEPASPTGPSTTEVTFTVAGTFPYYCEFHANMTGVIWVVD